jgi:hypothetical protein
LADESLAFSDIVDVHQEQHQFSSAWSNARASVSLSLMGQLSGEKGAMKK